MLYSINKKKTAILVIDVQNEYFDETCSLYTENAKLCEDNIARILQLAQNENMEVFFIYEQSVIMTSQA